MTFYTIKYIVTKGIEAFDGDVCSDGRYAASRDGAYCRRFERLGAECFYSHDEARAAAKVALASKIKSGEKALAALHKKLADIEGSKGDAK